MSDRRYSLVSDNNSEQTTKTATDWNKCIICQTDTSDILQCPAKKNDGDGYNSLVEHLQKFSHIGCLPFDIERLDEGHGITETLISESAKIHKMCRLEYSKSRLQRATKRKMATPLDPMPTESKKYTRSQRGSAASTGQVPYKQNVCFLCDEADSINNLHIVATFGCDNTIRRFAALTEDKSLLAKLSAGDLIAQEAKYHAACKLALHNKARSMSSLTSPESNSVYISHGIALAELVSYIDEIRTSEELTRVFKLCELKAMYTDRLLSLGVEGQSYVHSSNLKERIMSHFPTMQAHKEGRDVLLVFGDDVGPAIKRACQMDCDDDGHHLAKAASIVRRDMLESRESKFNGMFQDNDQHNSVPSSLLALVGMILDGPSIKTRTHKTSQSTLSIAQLMQFNCHVRRRKDSIAVHHTLEGETPMPIYLGLVIHAETRKRKLVDKLYDLGLSISYDRVLSISTSLANSVCKQYAMDKVVCPPKLRGNLFTTAAVDNIDHNSSSTTAKSNFHGTGISLFQHPTHENPGVDRKIEHLDTESKTISPLPDCYSEVLPAMLPSKPPPVPALAVSTLPDMKELLRDELLKEKG